MINLEGLLEVAAGAEEFVALVSSTIQKLLCDEFSAAEGKQIPLPFSRMIQAR